MKLSARNKLPGIVETIVIDGLQAKVGIRVGDNHIVAVVTAEAIDELELKVGDDVTAVIKSSSVMLAK
ncbi:MAG: TOBE domain-containing protein [Candidatus Eremiobacteraeota bacterium]|nr:TOBE domain-containing protein [Candidatus Eremiobacteraeota bacterium]MBV8364979.1 TOBE domain-containing protein [Candidatus Eremiobacteraeota bacterium]